MVRATRVRKHKRNKPVSNGTCNVSAHTRKINNVRMKMLKRPNTIMDANELKDKIISLELSVSETNVFEKEIIGRKSFIGTKKAITVTGNKIRPFTLQYDSAKETRKSAMKKALDIAKKRISK